ncbi:MAG: hypothetical protein HC831_11540, partial [Chloroflexia bacterium]|nr:hypothetical protein [Chloroflexia bacterium]
TASASVKDEVVNITLTNANPNKAISVECDLSKNYKSVSGQIVTGKEITDFNDFGKEEKVKMADFDIKKIKKGKLNCRNTCTFCCICSTKINVP